ncbi:hypothetical protein [Falsiruegeria litorea]
MENGTLHPMAAGHIPDYVVAADGSDYLFTFMVFFTLGLILLIGVGYFTLHSLPERMAHESNHSQFQVVGILALIALFTHNNLFWVLAVVVAGFRFPDYLSPMESIAQSLARLAGFKPSESDFATDPVEESPTEAVTEPAPKQEV